MDELRDEVQEFQERWNSMVLDITEDFKITCDEAQAVHGWIASERDAYIILKEKIDLEIRSIRAEYDLDEQTAQIQPYATLLQAVDELSRKAGEMDLRANRIIAQCEGSD